MAATLRAELERQGLAVSHSAALELVARQLGLANWNVLAARIAVTEPPAVALEPPVPILRIYDLAVAMAFYRDWLGFRLDWEHRFGEDFPLYAQLSRGACRLHLSQHHGDASPGGAVFIPLRGIAAFHQELSAKPNPFMRPGLITVEWGIELAVTDPFSNRLRFCEHA